MTETAPYAVITGASSGIGLELARQFADHGYDVLICAEDDELRTAATDLAGTGANVEAVQADLATDAGQLELVRAVRASGRTPDALALNAGIGNGGRFLDIPMADEERLIALNIGSTVRLAKELLPSMVARGTGGVLFTASVAATMPGPFYATYAASKSFVMSFAEALRHELKDTGVTVTALMPGPTDTEFFERSDMEDTKVGQAEKDDPADVAKDGFEALQSGKDHVVAGSRKNAAQTASGRLMTEKAKAAMHAKMTEP